MAGEALDFGTGFFTGAGTGFQVGSKFGPYGGLIGAGAGGIALGALSLFGGGEERRLQNQVNAQAVELGEMQVSAARREERAQRERDRKKKAMGRALSGYFQNRKAS